MAGSPAAAIVQTGTGRNIVERPAEEYVAEFVRHANARTAIKGAAAPAARDPAIP
jgi:ABC-type proline/glycine betaine transport system ATPase subunit